MAEKDREKWEQLVSIYNETSIKIVSEDDPYTNALVESSDELRELIIRLEYLGYKLGWLDRADTEITPAPTGDGWAFIDAGSEYGSRRAWYEVVGGVLVLRDEGDHDNLAGNDACLDFEGLTLKQAYAKAKALDSEPVGHDYDGCHACKWGIEIREVDNPADCGAEFLTYEEPDEAEQLRELIRAFLGKKVSFAGLRASLA